MLFLQNLLLLYIILSIILITTISKTELTEIVTTDKGPIRGEILETVQWQQKYSAFKGIPYAQPPIGYGRRFRRPVPREPWKDVLITKNDSQPCVQFRLDISNFLLGSEDCLYLNVYTPQIKFTKPTLRAVMVWIHGGAFQFGSADSSFYGPDFFIEKDVVIVAMNYRLGVFGFLTYLPQHFGGNNGLKDQVEALHWVQRNIRKFGGDPKKVTIFGESAGAVAVELHKLSPMSKGLFRASIAMSGSALNSWAVQDYDKSSSRGWYITEFLLRFQWLSYEEVYRQMCDVSTTHVLEASLIMIPFTLDLIPFKPTVESTQYESHPFLVDQPINIYRSRKFSDTPHILGLMKDEMLTLANFIPYVETIFGEDLTRDLIYLTTYLEFEREIDHTQRLLTTYGAAPVYYYRNSFSYSKSIHNIMGMGRLKGSGHADDLAHIFYIQNMSQSLNPNSKIGKHREIMVTMWTNFAKYLTPILPKNRQQFSLTWKVSYPGGHRFEIS